MTYRSPASLAIEEEVEVKLGALVNDSLPGLVVMLLDVRGQDITMQRHEN